MYHDGNNPRQNTDWQQDAECFDIPTEIFYPEGVLPASNYEVKTPLAICRDCPVIKQCAKYVLDSRTSYYPIKHGIWAGVRFPDGSGWREGANERRAKAYAKLEAVVAN